MKKLSHEKKHKVKLITAQAVFAFVSLLLIPIYTIIFGTKESPWDFTLSSIGNNFNHRFSFILWGIVTSMTIAYFTLYLFETMDYSDRRARRYLVSSKVFLILTVLIPAIKDTLPFLHMIHIVMAGLFALFFIISILLFIQYLAKSNQRLKKTALTLLISCVGVSVVALFFMGLNGIVEIIFFIGITVFLALLSFVLIRFRKQKENKEQNLEIDKAKNR